MPHWASKLLLSEIAAPDSRWITESLGSGPRKVAWRNGSRQKLGLAGRFKTQSRRISRIVDGMLGLDGMNVAEFHA